MSLKRNIVGSYISQFYVLIIGIVMVPIYLRYLGAEAYGMVGFFTMLQAWFQLLDMGLTPTMARETARFNGGASDALSLRRLLRALEGLFVAIALMGATALICGAPLIATRWLKVSTLPLELVSDAVMLIALNVAVRWVCGLYRGAINGFERITWLSIFNIAMATARFVLVIPFMMYVSTSIVDFFLYQLAVAVFELVVLVSYTYMIFPAVPAGRRVPWQWEPLRKVLKFSVTIAFTSSVWILVTQTDKLMLSKLLPLAEYAYVTLAVLVASGVTVISGPIANVLMPRLTRYSAAGDEDGLVRLYRKATQLVGIIAIPAALVLALFAEQVLWVWTGDAAIARKVAPILTLYSLGNGILALGAFPYYLQFAKGDLKLHLIGNGLFLVVLIPTLVLATWQYGVIGAGFAWLIANMIYFFAWVPRVHARFVKGLHMVWLARDVAPIVLLTVIAGFLVRMLAVWPVERWLAGVGILLVSGLLVVVAAAGSPAVRELIGGTWRARFAIQIK